MKLLLTTDYIPVVVEIVPEEGIELSGTITNVPESIYTEWLEARERFNLLNRIVNNLMEFQK